MVKSGIKVFAPATIGNIGVGFDVLGMALEYPGDEIIGRLTDRKGLRITGIHGARELTTDMGKNTAGVAAQAVADHLGEQDIGIDLELYKNLPIGSGLGSSAASAVAGAMVVNELLRRPLSKAELFPLAMQGEKVASGELHGDNVAPSLLGGIQFIRDNASFDVHRVHSPPGLYTAVVSPDIEVLTSRSRGVLSEQVPLRKMVAQCGNLGGFLIGLQRSDFELIRRSLEDVVIEPQRARLIPHFHVVQSAAMDAGALGCSISGGGPSIFALCDNKLTAERVGEAMQKIFSDQAIKSRVIVSGINQEGAKLL